MEAIKEMSVDYAEDPMNFAWRVTLSDGNVLKVEAGDQFASSDELIEDAGEVVQRIGIDLVGKGVALLGSTQEEVIAIQKLVIEMLFPTEVEDIT